MDYNRLFYMNITYSCNNKCLFCISHNTKNSTRIVTNPFQIIKEKDVLYSFNKNDIFIINGGEPTLSSDFQDIVKFLITCECKIIIYTNGRLLKNFQDLLYSRNVYWIIPFYGLEKIHDSYTSINGSYNETFESLKLLKKNNVSIKFLLNEEKQIQDFYKLSKYLQDEKFQEIHLSFIINNSYSKRYELAEKTKDIYNYLKKHFTVKLSNIPLCGMQLHLNCKTILKKNINEYFFIYENGIVKRINYDENHYWDKKCYDCSMLNICCDTYKKYRVLKISDSISTLEEE